ncbi:P-loop containing nucleoside triphosphate hydrolase protein [Baffinella frigidus]|nr:P-loop containing nucleoside triphosphate hydrolase protein [Cryptophyta sp. CCMP2293]
MNDVRSALHVANKELARLSAEVRGSRIREAWETVISARDRCRAMKKGLRNLRKTTVAAAEQTREELRRAGEELLLLCSFILPLPHQAPEQVRVSKLTGPQLGAALRHMLSKYRSASLLARSLNAKAQAAKGALQVWCRGGGPGSLEKGEDALTTKAGGSKESSPNRLGGNGLLLNFRGEGCVSVVESSRGGLDRERGVKEFEFDAAFPPGTGQADIFSAAKDLVSTTLDGYKVSVIAYGPAGGGKTYSLFGSGGERGGGREAEAGLAHRFLSLVVEFAQEHAALLRIQVSLSAFEIHGDVMHDLLPRTAGKGAEDKEAAKHELKATVAADKGWGLGEVTIEGLSEHKVDAASKGDVLSSVLALALAAAEPGGGRAGASGVRREDRREEGASRGHVVVRVGVRSVATKPGGEVLNGKLTFVDLASSEPGLPGASEQGKHNRSLASLRDVFSAIASNKDRKHIPYRSSLLTKVLSDSLGGHARCLVLAAIPGASPHDNEIPRTSNHASKKSPTKAGKSDAGDGREKGGGGGGGKQSKDASLLWGVGGASGKSTLAVMTMVQEWRGVQLGSAPKHSERVPGEAIGGKGLEGRRSTDMDATGGMSKIIRASNDPAWFGSGSDDEGGGGGKGGGGREGGGGGGGGVGEEEVEELRREVREQHCNAAS